MKAIILVLHKIYEYCFRRNTILYIYCALVLFFMILPIIVVVIISFSSGLHFSFPPPGFSLDWYRRAFTSSLWMPALLTSLRIALGATVIAVILGTAASFALVRAKFTGKELINSFIIFPMIIPLIVLALAMYIFFSSLNLTGSAIGLILAHAILGLPYVVINVSAVLRGYNEDLERAAIILGASRIRTFFEVTYPLIKPGILSGALFAFIISFDEVIIAIFLSGPHVRTLPVVIWEQLRTSVDPTIAAVSSTIIFITVAVLILIHSIKKFNKNMPVERVDR